MSTHQATSEPIDRPLKSVSFDRLACLLRHWTWADEARMAFDRELAQVCDDDDENPVADRPFGSYYHWCALLCTFTETALDHGLLSASELHAIRHDLEEILPGLRACRQLLVVIPASFEEHPCVVDLLHNTETLVRLRRVHDTFGDALRKEQMLRQIDSLDH